MSLHAYRILDIDYAVRYTKSVATSTKKKHGVDMVAVKTIEGMDLVAKYAHLGTLIAYCRAVQ